eukprot:Awhi_evm1s11514
MFRNTITNTKRLLLDRAVIYETCQSGFLPKRPYFSLKRNYCNPNYYNPNNVLKNRSNHCKIACMILKRHTSSEINSPLRKEIYQSVLGTLPKTKFDSNNADIFLILHKLLDVAENITDAKLTDVSLDNISSEFQLEVKAEELNACASSLLGISSLKSEDAKKMTLTCAVLAAKFASNMDEHNAMYTYAGLLYNGLGVEKDHEASARLYKKIAQLGHPYAQLQFGLMCIRGEGVPQNGKIALSVLEAAARNKMIAAYNLMGTIYGQGIGVEVDHMKAASMYKSGVEANDPESCHNCAIYHLQGLGGLDKDQNKALEYFEKAANLGFVSSQ